MTTTFDTTATHVFLRSTDDHDAVIGATVRDGERRTATLPAAERVTTRHDPADLLVVHIARDASS